LLAEAGSGILGYEETEDWRDRQERTGRALLTAAAELAAESGWVWPDPKILTHRSLAGGSEPLPVTAGKVRVRRQPLRLHPHL
jgi:hypothetical protein